jgi:hypothetical protein
MTCQGCAPRGAEVLQTADQVRSCATCRASVLGVVYRAQRNGNRVTDQDARWAAAIDAGQVAALCRVGRAALVDMGLLWPQEMPADGLISTFDQLSAVALGPRATWRGKGRK